MRILLVDIETSPTSAAVWGLYGVNISINQIIKPGRTLCAAMKWLGEPERKTVFVSSWTTGFDAMIQKIHDHLAEADAVVTYNGQKFDLPVLNREFLLAGLTPPSPSKSIDLYRTVRKQFKFVSNKLDFVCQQLGLGAKTHHKGMDLWTGVENGVKADQKTMEVYNKQDVFLLEKLYNRLLPWIPNHPSTVVHDRLTDAPRCPTCGSDKVQRRGYHVTKVARFHRLHCQDCGTWSRERQAAEKAVPTTLVGV
jgi:DNA polymerase elongation subunit (family B)